MQVKRTNISDTEVILIISGDSDNLLPIKEHVLKEHFAAGVNIPGFRSGKAPLNLIEKHVDQARFQNQFLEEAVNDLFSRAINQEKLRSIDQPSVEIKKFVPYTQLEFEAKVAVLGPITLADYKNIKVAKPTPQAITAKDIDSVLQNIRKQIAEKKDVQRAAKNGDQVLIDFQGVDDKGKPVNGADGKEYPLTLGSDSFIPGFEANLVGLKAGDEKSFTLKFPKDYSLKALANKDVTFSTKVVKVQEIVEPELNDELAAKVGPFKDLDALKDDVKKELTQERINETDRDYESAVLKAIADKSKVTVPDVLINGEVEKKLRELSQNLVYRGQTLEEFFEQEGKTEKQYIDDILKPESADRLKASIILSEISELEKVDLTNEEIDLRIQIMKAQYRDPQSVAELDKPEMRREIASRLLAEKTISRLVGYSSK